MECRQRRGEWLGHGPQGTHGRHSSHPAWSTSLPCLVYIHSPPGLPLSGLHVRGPAHGSFLVDLRPYLRAHTSQRGKQPSTTLWLMPAGSLGFLLSQIEIREERTQACLGWPWGKCRACLSLSGLTCPGDFFQPQYYLENKPESVCSHSFLLILFLIVPLACLPPFLLSLPSTTLLLSFLPSIYPPSFSPVLIPPLPSAIGPFHLILLLSRSPSPSPWILASFSLCPDVFFSRRPFLVTLSRNVRHPTAHPISVSCVLTLSPPCTPCHLASFTSLLLFLSFFMLLAV